MQKMMGFFAQRLLQELFVQALDVRVLMGKPYFLVFIILIQRLGAQRTQLVGNHIRLPAAAHAASGTGHDFHEMIRQFLSFFLGLTDLVNDILDVA
jgi:hypothetical protein